MYDFNKRINRRGTSCMKYDNTPPSGATEDVIPMWVADMDFEVLPEIKDALIQRVNLGIYGYTKHLDAASAATVDWMKRRHDWDISPEWITTSPGVVAAIKNAIRAFTMPGDKIIIQRPVYYPFFTAAELNNRVVVNSPLINDDGYYKIDFNDFERKVAENHPKLFILCNPHNPVGRVWSKEDLAKLGEICLKYGVIVVADEIHHDFVFKGYKYTPFIKVDSRFADITITCTAPSKTFNLAGLKVSNIIIPNQELRNIYNKEKTSSGLAGMNYFGEFACAAAYMHGDKWVDELLDYIASNFAYLDSFLKEKLPELKLIKPEGLYLAWVDCHGLNMDNEGIKQLFLSAGLWLDSGDMFGPEGESFMRFNLACPRSTLETALQRLLAAFNRKIQDIS